MTEQIGDYRKDCFEKARAFEAELKALLAKYECRISAADHWTGYAECGEDVRIEADIKGSCVTVDLGSSFDASDVAKIE
jgi:predicted component of type VI protein secretion system